MSSESEREALALVVARATREARNVDILRVADEILASGFRRSEVPQPSAIIDDGTDDAWQAIADALGNLGYDLNSHEETAAWVQQYLFTSEPQGEPSDAQVAEIEQRVYDQHRGQIAGMAKALVRAGWDAAVGSQR